jgi:tetratricopeptide (TPR) repeat protein
MDSQNASDKTQHIFTLVLLVILLLATACQPVHPVTPTPGSQTVTAVPTATGTATNTVTNTATAKADQPSLPPTAVPTRQAVHPAPPPLTSTVVATGADANRLLQEGIQYVEAGELESAVTTLTKAINLNPELVDAYIYRGIAHAYLDEFDAAIQDLTEAIRLDPENTDAHVYRGASNYFLGHYAAAVKDCTDAIHLSKGYFLPVEICINVMGLLSAADFEEIDAAIKDYDAAIREDPSFAGAYLFRGFAYRTQGNIQAAIADLEQALRLDSFLGDILLFCWSQVYYQPADADAAIQELVAAQALVEPDSWLADLVESTLNQLRSGQ